MGKTWHSHCTLLTTTLAVGRTPSTRHSIALLPITQVRDHFSHARWMEAVWWWWCSAAVWLACYCPLEWPRRRDALPTSSCPTLNTISGSAADSKRSTWPRRGASANAPPGWPTTTTTASTNYSRSSGWWSTCSTNRRRCATYWNARWTGTATATYRRRRWPPLFKTKSPTPTINSNSETRCINISSYSMPRFWHWFRISASIRYLFTVF